MNRAKQLLNDVQEGRRGITWQIWLPGLKQPIGMVLSNPKEGLNFGGLSQGRNLKRETPGEGLLLGALRVEFGTGEVRPECEIRPQARDHKQKQHLGIPQWLH